MIKESSEIKEQLLALSLSDQEHTVIKKPDGLRLIVRYSIKRAKKDRKNRERGLKRLEKNQNKVRIESHICIALVAYTIYKKLKERWSRIGYY